MKVLVTGGAGYIGTHTLVELINNGITPVVACRINGRNIEALNEVELLTGKMVIAYDCDIVNIKDIDNIFQMQRDIVAVIHLASMKDINKCNEDIFQAHAVNVTGTINVLKVMSKYKCKNFIFASSSMVHSDKLVSNVYKETKMVVEGFLNSFHTKHPEWSIGILRIFNPCGIHFSGKLLSSTLKPPINFFDSIVGISHNDKKSLPIYGNRFETIDGTLIKDFIHVSDVAKGIYASLISILQKPKFIKVDIGTGEGTTLLQMINTYREISSRYISYYILPARDFDDRESIADALNTEKLIGWKSQYVVKDICESMK